MLIIQMFSHLVRHIKEGHKALLDAQVGDLRPLGGGRVDSRGVVGAAVEDYDGAGLGG